ncbi:DUF3558 family protein [Antrihabitans cavernicola]|uniref:DUF3558 family protein n=1 Tax=Antrihabitans cavernicola TaxID=2495913 RepID=UPI00165930B5|nr:DUF3558 family protein [Spelaeibacter cavernicola]
MALVAGGALTGCGSNETSSQQPHTSPESASTVAAPATLTARQYQPPKQRNQGGRPDVVYDPCTYVNDETIKALGLDPASRERDDFLAEYTIFDCKFKSTVRRVTISSGNITMEQERTRYAGMIENLTVNGREAMIVREPEEVPESCALNMRTDQGIARISTLLTVEGLYQKLDRCDGIVDIAKAVEPTIGKGK